MLVSPLILEDHVVHIPCLYNDTVPKVNNAALAVREAAIVENW